MKHAKRRRAYALVYMLSALLILGLLSGLMSVSIPAVLRSQRQVHELSNRFATLTDMMDTLRSDVRRGETLALDTRNEGSDTTLAIGFKQSDTQEAIVYRLRNDVVTRKGGGLPPLTWKMKGVGFAARVEAAPNQHAPLLHVEVYWRRTAKDMPTRHRRFDFSVRAARTAIAHDED